MKVQTSEIALSEGVLIAIGAFDVVLVFVTIVIIKMGQLYHIPFQG